MKLPLKIRLKLIRQQIYARLFESEKVVSIEETENGVLIRVGGEAIRAPSPWRWKLYRKGWPARLDQLETEYGIPRHFQLSPESTVLDVGANAGEFAHVCARFGATVYCFEADPQTHLALMENIKGLNNASAHEMAIWKESGVIEFGLAPDQADSSVFVEDRKISVPAETVAGFCKTNGIAKVDLIKCDAEGAEPEVLEGIGDYFEAVKGVALDTGAERMGERTHDACAAILSQNGFDVIEEKIGTRWMTYGVRPG